MSDVQQRNGHESMKWLIIEDEAGQIINWLAVLQDNCVNGSTKLCSVNWGGLLEHSKHTYSTKPPTSPFSLPTDCELLRNDKHVFGVASGEIIVLCVMTRTAGEDVVAWLQANIPSMCLSFLDYVLAGDPDAKLAELIAPHLTRSFSQVCVNHSSRLPGLDASPMLGLSSEHLPFYKTLQKRLIEPKAAKACVSEAVDFWKSLNDCFTTYQDVDRVIGLFARGKAGNWDSPNGPFHHDTLDNPKSTTHHHIKALGLIPTAANDNLKGLFQCDPGVRRASGKKVYKDDLKNALKVIGLEAVRLDVTERWCPPFLPGILFLCHLKLMYEAYAKPKDGEQRLPPVLIIGDKSATFAFEVEVEHRMGNWQSEGSNSFRLMQAVEKVLVGEEGAQWLSTTAAKEIADLLQPKSVKPLKVVPLGKSVHISW